MPVRIFRILAVAAALLPVSVASAEECRDDLNEADGYTIRSVRVEGRWVPSIALPIKPGDRFSNAKIQAAMGAVREALHNEERREFELESLGAVGVLHITRCLLVDGRNVDVVIRARSVRVDLFEVGGNVLPIPRSVLATFYDAVPPIILALNPTFGAYQDKEYGFAPTASIASNMRGFDLTAGGRKSVENSFYNADANLAFSKSHPGDLLEQLSLGAAYHGAREPRGNSFFTRQAGEFGINLRMRPRLGLVQTLALGASYRYAENRFTSGGERAKTGEHAAQLHALIEGRAGGAFLRAAVWADGGMPDRGSSYGRIAALAACEKEFLLGHNQTIGLEAVIGGGKAWSAPAYAEFYGGNTSRDFLYDSLNSPALAAFPSGPVIRSFGEAQSLAQTRNGDRGSSSYWHVNLNISLPIPALSYPLIPDEEIAPGISLKRLLKNKAGDSVAYYAVQLEEEGLSPAEALAKAKAMYGEVSPAIEFIADRANVYSLKPLLLFDLAGQEGNGRGHRFESAFGGGLQLTIVTAKMEAGYMHTLAGGDSGNFFARIVFQNIF